MIAALLLAHSVSALALPNSPSVVSGGGSYAITGPGAVFTQSAPLDIINWSSFSIAPGEGVTFVQPSPTSAVLNRVTSGSPTVIEGNLSTSGLIFLINPAGFIFKGNGSWTVGSLTLSTLDISDSDFLAGRPNFLPNDLNGSISFSGTGVFTLSGGGTLSLFGGPWVANGNSSGSTTLSSGGSISSGGSVITVGGNLSEIGGSISISPPVFGQVDPGVITISGGSIDSPSIDLSSPVPEPSSWILLAGGMLALVGMSRRRLDH